MRENLTRTLARWRRTFSSFSVGQKAVVIVGGAALLLAAFLVVRWVSTPSYAPLYTNLASSDASAVIDELNSEGVPYKLTDNGQTVEVPQDEVYSTRIALSGKGLPAGNADLGYSQLDGESLSTSDFQEQTDFKRAMEGELDKTLEAMQGVQTAVVHLAMPQKQVFTDQQDPTTASVLLALSPGVTLTSEQVQAIVHTVASSIDGLDPKNVTVTDSKGNLLSASDTDGASGLTTTQADAKAAYETQMTDKIQGLLDRIVGPGNAHATVTSVLDFDQRTTDARTYGTKTSPPLSESHSSETYAGAAGSSPASGVVGPDGQMDPTTSSTTSAGGDSSYKKNDVTRDNAVDQEDTHTVSAPGAVKSLHIGVVLDSAAIGTIQPAQVRDLISSAVGIDVKRGDSLDVSSMPFNRTAEQSAQKELDDAAAADKKSKQLTLLRNLGLGVLVALLILIAWLRSRRRAAARDQARTYLVEQLRADAATRSVELEAPPALAALEAGEEQERDDLRSEIAALVDGQPEDVAAMLRSWLVEQPR